MATPAEATAATKIYYEETDPGDIVFKADPLFYFLMRGFDGNYSRENFQNALVDPKDMTGGGRQHEFQLEIALANNGGLTDATVVDLSQKQIFTFGYETFGSAYASTTIFHSENRDNYGPEKVFDLVSKKVSNCQKSAQDQIAVAVLQHGAYTGGRLQSALCDLFNTTTTTAYLGIQENDVSLWKANKYTTAANPTLAHFQYLARTAKVNAAMDGQPNLYLASQVLVDSYEQGLDTQKVIRDADAANHGWYNVMFRNAPVVADFKMDTDTTGILSDTSGGTGQGSKSILGLNTKFLSLKIHKNENFKATDWMSAPDQPQNMSMTILSSQMLITTHRAAHIWSDNVTAS